MVQNQHRTPMHVWEGASVALLFFSSLSLAGVVFDVLPRAHGLGLFWFLAGMLGIVVSSASLLRILVARYVDRRLAERDQAQGA